MGGVVATPLLPGALGIPATPARVAPQRVLR